MVNYVARMRSLANIYGSQAAAARSIGISQAYYSRLLSGKRKNISKEIKSKISRRYNYNKKKYLYQPRVKVKVSGMDGPIWVTGKITEIDGLEENMEETLQDLGERYDIEEVLKVSVKRYKG